MKMLFPSCIDVKIALCDFHRKQAWNRWVSALKNGVVQHKEDILNSLNVNQQKLSMPVVYESYFQCSDCL